MVLVNIKDQESSLLSLFQEHSVQRQSESTTSNTITYQTLRMLPCSLRVTGCKVEAVVYWYCDTSRIKIVLLKHSCSGGMNVWVFILEKVKRWRLLNIKLEWTTRGNEKLVTSFTLVYRAASEIQGWLLGLVLFFFFHCYVTKYTHRISKIFLRAGLQYYEKNPTKCSCFFFLSFGNIERRTWFIVLPCFINQLWGNQRVLKVWCDKVGFS